MVPPWVLGCVRVFRIQSSRLSWQIPSRAVEQSEWANPGHGLCWLKQMEILHTFYSTKLDLWSWLSHICSSPCALPLSPQLTNLPWGLIAPTRDAHKMRWLQSKQQLHACSCASSHANEGEKATQEEALGRPFPSVPLAQDFTYFFVSLLRNGRFESSLCLWFMHLGLSVRNYLRPTESLLKYNVLFFFLFLGGPGAWGESVCGNNPHREFLWR